MAGIKEEKKIYLVGIYCRLSKDDGTDNESASIATQKSILTDYVKKQGWHIAKTYVDDGYSGTNFQRPSFQNMIKDIESGLINCVITKDLSRLGRNYLDCGLYLEVFFPEHNVRYIAVNDGVDTLNKSAMDITPFRNILNEMYAADISVKIKSAYRARFQQGKFMGTTAPYGYIKDPADHNHLLIDDKVAHVVKEIFDLALKGNGVAKICRHLNKQHILRPAAYAAERGETGFERHFEGNEDKRYIWSGNSVRSILRSPIYAGNLVGYKRIAANMKSKKRPSKLPEEWEVIPNTHEGIVTQEEFDIVQQLITSRRLPQNKGGFVNIFAGVIKCVDCGCALRAMNVHRRKRPEIIDCVQYSCNNYARNGRSECSAHNIEARDLFNAVLADINCFADMAVNDEKAVRAIEKRLTETDQSRAKALEKERKKLNKRLAELDRLFSSLYEDKVMERITERNFEMMSGKYQKEQLEIEARLKEVTETLNESYEKSRGIRDFLALIRNYQGLKELDATVINALIDKILVSEREKMADGTVKQEIKIYYKFIGFVDELHIIPTKRWAAMPAKNCTVCGVEYVPGSGASRYCSACAKKIRREKSNESKRRSREQKRIACMNCPQKMTDWNGPETPTIPPLAGTQFTICYYDGYFTKDNLPDYDSYNSTAKRKWVIEVKWNEKTKKYMAGLTEEYLVDELSDDLYYFGGMPVLPLGTISIQETKSAPGYDIDGKFTDEHGNIFSAKEKYVTQIVDNKSGVAIQGGNKYKGENKPHPNKIRIRKVDENGNPLAGATFTLMNSKGEIVSTKTSGSDGYVVWEDLYPDRYTVTEIKTKDGKNLLKDPIVIELPRRITDEDIKKYNIDKSKLSEKDPTEGKYFLFDVEYEISNHATFEAPSTGGFTDFMTFLPLVGGMAGLTGVGAVVMKRKRKK